MSTGLTLREIRGPQRVEQPMVGVSERRGNPMAILGFILSMVALLMSPLALGIHMALGFTVPLASAAVSYIGYWQATRQARPYRTLARAGLIISLLVHIVIVAVTAFVIGVAIAVTVGFVIFLLDPDGGKRTRRRRSGPYRRRSSCRRTTPVAAAVGRLRRGTRSTALPMSLRHRTALPRHRSQRRVAASWTRTV